MSAKAGQVQVRSGDTIDDRERRIRQAVIRSVKGTSATASWDLECLADDPDVIAGDLRAAIESARSEERDEREGRRRAHNADLVRLAIAEEVADEVAIGQSLDRLQTTFAQC